jgi:hypothetical protein
MVIGLNAALFSLKTTRNRLSVQGRMKIHEEDASNQ